MSRGPDAGTALRRAVERDAARAGCVLKIAASEETRWASATFIGARHRFTLGGNDDPTFATWLYALPEANLPIRGHLVADLAIVSVDRAAGCATAHVEALTVET